MTHLNYSSTSQIKFNFNSYLKNQFEQMKKKDKFRAQKLK